MGKYNMWGSYEHQKKASELQKSYKGLMSDSEKRDLYNKINEHKYMALKESIEEEKMQDACRRLNENGM